MVKNISDFIPSMRELQGEKVKLCSNNDPESQLILAECYIDEDIRRFFGATLNLHSKQDVLQFWGLNEKGEKISEKITPGCKGFIIKNSANQPVGKCLLTLWEEETSYINIGYWIAKQFWGNGYALDVVKIIIENFHENKIAAHLNWIIEPVNSKSLRAFEKIIRKLGFNDFEVDETAVKTFSSPNYLLEQKTILFTEKYEIDDKKPDIAVCSWWISGKKIQENIECSKMLIKPEFIESGFREVTYLQFLLTPRFEYGENAESLSLKNVFNLRELGGFKVEGKTTKFKQFLRSDNPERLTDEEIQILKDYGVKTVIDLRSEKEINKAPDKFQNVEGVKYHHLEIRPPKTLKREATIPEIYIEVTKYTENNGLKDIFETIANVEEGTILFHCIHGKDRTGVLAALLLRLVDVSKEDISEDYGKSCELMKDADSMKELINERGSFISHSLPEYIETAIEFIESTYGRVQEYLLACGVSSENVDKIKNKLI